MAERTLFRTRFDTKRVPGFATLALFTFVALYVPTIILVVYSFNEGTSLAIWEGFSLRWYQQAFNNEAVREAGLRSLYLATVAASVATVAATMAALATTRKKAFKGQTYVYALINQPLMVPEIVTAVALLIFFALIKVATGYTGMLYLILAHTAFCIPFAYLPIRARLESMDLTLETAAADLYASPWMTFRRVTLPLMWPGIVAGLMLAFVISLDTVVITEFIKSAGQETLPTYMLGQLRRVVTPEVNAISTVLLAISITFVAFFFYLTGRKS
ncbi:MAG: ABC transporter permease [Sedimentitalea sp.]